MEKSIEVLIEKSQSSIRAAASAGSDVYFAILLARSYPTRENFDRVRRLERVALAEALKAAADRDELAREAEASGDNDASVYRSQSNHALAVAAGMIDVVHGKNRGAKS